MGLYRALADAVVLVHFLWIVFLVLGGIWGRRSRPVRAFHISGLALAVLVQASGWYCPLTYLEVYLREKGDPSGAYEGSFIARYAEDLVYLDLSRGLVAALTAALCALNAWLYLRRGRRGF
ncbi:MAG: hypothetical protein Kow0025_09400 [Thermodesulfovibrionales bacterium]